MKKLYVGATEQHAGKTCLCLGLYSAARQRGYDVCLTKPVGQRYVLSDGKKVDEDAVLFKHALEIKGNIKDLNPVTIPRGFTFDYVFNRDPERTIGEVLKAFNRIEKGHDLAIIEGTGHAGVGSVIDASNADVAKMLGADCIIVSVGGIGRCIDEIVLNRALFERSGVPLLGAIINKVFEEKYDHINGAVRQGLANLGIDCLGVVPYRKELTYPTVARTREELDLELVCGEDFLGNRVHSIVVAAMAPHHAVDYLEDGSLVVVPGDRIDNILTSVYACLMSGEKVGPRIAGLVLTGGFVPHPSIVNMLCQVRLPVLLSEADTASTAFKVQGLVAKLTEKDSDKIQLAQELVEKWVDTDKIFSSLGLS